MSDTNSGQTGNGFITGVESGKTPAELRAEQAALNGQSSQQQPAATAPSTEHRFTAEDIERARQDEKAKVYGRVDELAAQLKVITDREAAAQKAVEDAQKAADAVEEQRRLGEMTSKELILKLNQDQTEKMKALQDKLDYQDSLLDMERRFQALQQYTTNQLSAQLPDGRTVHESIVPDLLPLISGNNEQEVLASIQRLQAVSQSMVNGIREQQQAEYQALRGASPTGLPAFGPLEDQAQQAPKTTAQLKGMTMQEFAANRNNLLAATGRMYRGGN